MKLDKTNEVSAADQVVVRALVTSLEEFISKRELACRLKKSVRTVSNWQRRGIIPYVKCGRAVLFKWVDVEAHLKKHFHNCPPSTPPESLPRDAVVLPTITGAN
jgi:excisionase family DNA binding protein